MSILQARENGRTSRSYAEMECQSKIHIVLLEDSVQDTVRRVDLELGSAYNDSAVSTCAMFKLTCY